MIGTDSVEENNFTIDVYTPFVIVKDRVLELKSVEVIGIEITYVPSGDTMLD